MRTLEAMQIFVEVAEQASFTQAAANLALPKASVSVAVQQLEAELETRLLHRTTRRVALTQDGQAYYERCKDLLADFEDAQNLFRDDGAALRGRLRVDMPSAIARDVVLPRLAEFLAEHPALEVELSSTDRRVDLVREGFDCVVRVGQLGDAGYIARPLGHYQMVNCASPAYLARFGQPRSLEDLHAHRLVHYVSSFGNRDPGFEYLDPDTPSEKRFLPMSGALTVNSADAYYAACLAGLGIIQVPFPGVAASLQAGALETILPRWRAAPMPVSLIYAQRRHQPRRVQLFMRWLESLLRPRLAEDADITP
ncbi:LysR family transcriptional regulator [uncultured Aquitalea sp.]|uniref:LysR family transcriptional regulator n=1 Tax=uncultured Aquitalea sp. TaxID=540272 RepID=UPI0025DDE04B|nr:LysR family transcriptional regulator [uncultured Aquitalea sp.]